MKGLYRIIFLLCFLSVIAVSGQKSEKIKALEKELAVAKEDTVKANILYKLGAQYRKSDPVVAEDYARQSIEISKKGKDHEMLGKGYQLLGVIKKYQGDLRLALQIYDQARAQYEVAGDISGLGDIINNIGVVYKNLGQLDSAMMMYDLAILQFERIDSREGMAKVYMNMGIVMKHKADYEQAVSYYLKSLKLYESTNNAASIAKCYKTPRLL